MKDETGGVAIEETVGLKPKMYSFWLGNNEHKKAKGMNKNVVATIGHNEYKNVLLKNKCLRHQQNFIVCFWWQNMYSKQLIQWISSQLSELIIKKKTVILITI